MSSVDIALESAPQRSAGGAADRWRVVARTPLGVGALVAVVLVLALAVFAPLMWGEGAEEVDTNALNQGPSGAHLFGTDNLGRDIVQRVLVATSLSMALALAATAIGLVIGVLLGAAPTVLGRRAGRFITAVVNVLVAFPGLLLALFFASIFGVGARQAVLALGLAVAPSFARLTQTLAASVAGRDYVSAARVIGISRTRVLLRHVLPNIGEPLIVNATLGAAGSLLAFASLSFLGLGVQPPQYDWGRLLGEGLNNIYSNPMAALAPGIAVVLAGLALNLFGEAAAQVIGRRTMNRRMGAMPSRATEPRPVAPDGDVLTVEDLWVRFPAGRQWVSPVRGVSFSVAPGEAIGIVGESGSGKTLTMLALASLVQAPGAVDAARLDFAGERLLTGSGKVHRRLLGTSLALVFQDPMTSMNPTMRVGRQLAEIAEEHQSVSRRTALDTAVEKLRAVRIPAAGRRARQYPHEMSGGMRQRAMIAMGLMGSPRLLIADEPTTALDVTVQRQVLQLLAAVRAESGAALLFISHDIAVVSQLCERVLVMYAGRIVEDLSVTELMHDPRHPYTRALLSAVPDMDTPLDQPLATIAGRPPQPGHAPVGCAFAPRCAFATAQCESEDPALTTDAADPAGRRRIACWHPQTENAVATSKVSAS
jgi:oligopeptide/dipeptide ABC transporter ATP-binding protein